MKKINKTFSLLILTLVICMLFTGCGDVGNSILAALSIDTEINDPATVMVADTLGKKVKSTDNKSGDFTYTAYEDNTAAITAYSGKDSVLSIPDKIDGMTVVGIDNKALMKTETLKELILPDCLEAVGNYALMYCNALEKVTFGKGIKNIGISAFESDKNSQKARGGLGSLKTLVFNGAPQVIGEKAFYYCDKLTEIVLPQGVEEIGEWAFAKCFSAKRIIIPDGVKVIGDHAFLKCIDATEVYIPGSCGYIDVSMFYQCTSIQKLTIGEGIKEIRKGAFEECKSLKKVELPQSVETIGKYAFYNCTSLESITIHPGTVNFSSDIFKNDGTVKIAASPESAAEVYAGNNSIEVVPIS